MIVREVLRDGRAHLTVSGKFQSDKYRWCPAGFVPLKTSDPMAADLLKTYAERRHETDPEFANDLMQALGFEACAAEWLRRLGLDLGAV